MARIIFNADDLGWSRGVNRGIVHAYQHGVVNSATLMTTAAHFDEAVALIAEHQLENIGLHFNLTEGRALLRTHKTLCDPDQSFFRGVHERHHLDSSEVYKELEAQYLKAFKAGVRISHLDSHHHIHMTARLRKVFVAFAKQYHLPLRRFKNTARNPFRIASFYSDTWGAKYFTKDFTAEFYGENATQHTLLNLLKNYKGSDLEIMCHPGYEDPENGIYNEERETELEVLISSEIKIFLARNNK